MWTTPECGQVIWNPNVDSYYGTPECGQVLWVDRQNYSRTQRMWHVIDPSVDTFGTLSMNASLLLHGHI